MAEMLARFAGTPPSRPLRFAPFFLGAFLVFSGAACAQQAASGTAESGKKESIAPFGSHMTVQKQEAGVGVDSVLDAIGNSKATAQDVKIMSKLDQVKIVHLGKALDGGRQSRVEKAVKDHLDDVKALRTALEGNALTFAALNAQSVATEDIVGAEVSGDRQKTITVFARH